MFNSKKKTEETAAEEVKKAPETAPAKEETAKTDKSEANSNPAEKKEPADIIFKRHFYSSKFYSRVTL